jgi:opacity protein-like surface antigen
MRPLFILILGAISACSQPISFGVKGGVPATDFFDTVNRLNAPASLFHSGTNRYIVGPTVELRLPFGLGVEVDALYRHFNYNSSTFGVDVLRDSRTTGNAWEFPLLAKYRFPTKIVRPYIDAGVAWDTLSGLTQTIRQTLISGPITSTVTTSNPDELHKTTTRGFVTGVGLDVHALFIHISPEIRYTRWGARHFLSPNGGLSSNQNQAEFLLGLTF